MKHFRKGQRVRSVYDPKHEFVIAESFKPRRMFYEKATKRWWAGNELPAGASEKASTSLKRSGANRHGKMPGANRHGKMPANALRTLLAGPLAKATPSEPPAQKKCELNTCDVLFTPRRKWQKFCCEKHCQEFHKQQRENAA